MLLQRPLVNKREGLLGAHSYAHAQYIVYSATREDDTTFIFSHFGLFLSDAASNAHK